MRFVSMLAMGVMSLVSPVWAAAEPDYFPLQVGNWWEYEQFVELAPQGVLRRTVVIGSKTVQGNEYSILVRHFGAAKDTLLVRSYEQQVLVHTTESEYGDGEFPWLDFSRPEGTHWDAWLPLFPGQIELTVSIDRYRSGHSYILDQLVSRALGQQALSDNFLVGFASLSGAEISWEEIYVNGVGPVVMLAYNAITGFDLSLVLRRAYVKGESLDLTGVEQQTWGQTKYRFLKVYP